MNIYLYVSSAETNEFPKQLPEPSIFEGSLRGECDILNPVIIFTGFNPAAQFNYAYIPEYNRYYFITGSNIIRTNVIEYSMHVDVLNSWYTYLKELSGAVLRNEYTFNPMIIDEQVELLPADKVNKLESNGEEFVIYTNPNEMESCLICASNENKHYLVYSSEATSEPDLSYIFTYYTDNTGTVGNNIFKISISNLIGAPVNATSFSSTFNELPLNDFSKEVYFTFTNDSKIIYIEKGILTKNGNVVALVLDNTISIPSYGVTTGESYNVIGT